jgi:hypothetical protein
MSIFYNCGHGDRFTNKDYSSIRRKAMCGGFKPSRKWLRSKEDEISRELDRLSNLKQGSSYVWPLATGHERFTFEGHVRSENLDSVWTGKISRHVKVLADSFSERDTVGGSRKLIPFPVPPGSAIHGVITNEGKLRIVTQEATGEVRSVHHRMPHWVSDNPTEGQDALRASFPSLYER